MMAVEGLNPAPMPDSPAHASNVVAIRPGVLPLLNPAPMPKTRAELGVPHYWRWVAIALLVYIGVQVGIGVYVFLKTTPSVPIMIPVVAPPIDPLPAPRPAKLGDHL